VKCAYRFKLHLEGNSSTFQVRTNETGGKTDSSRIEDEEQEGLLSWEEMYGIGKGVWEIDAQEYVNQLREERD
jgi:hypothetical protein